MTQHAHLDPSPFLLPAGPTGVLLIHGYTGSPTEMRWVADSLHARGLTVAGPLLPGHGTTPEEMNRCRWTDWTGHVEKALADLRARCDKVFVAGLSMGSLLTLYLALRHPELPGIILYSPAVWVNSRLIYLSPLARYFVTARPKSSESDLVDPKADLQLWCYDVDPVGAAAELLKLMLYVRRRLRRVTCPTLIIYSPGDLSIHPQSAQRTFQRIGAADKELVMLERSGHCITVDVNWQLVADKTYEFIRSHGG
ncbi:MAG: alpha/beta fold hydrolase [Anaerolineae bacterium]|nr:alpha/beta fold hydrolase [Anaerolineae bacterium]